MNKKILFPLLACLLGLSVFVCSDSAQTEPTPTPPTTPGGQHQGRGHHPAIMMAIRALERAKAEMQAAANDYGGHKADALAACDNAIAQLQQALQYANQNPANPSAQPPTQPNTN
jgi:hypothetical protein